VGIIPSVLRILPLPVLVYFLYSENLRASLVVVGQSSTGLFLAVGLIIIFFARLVKDRKAVGVLASTNDFSFSYGVGLVVASFLLLVGGTYSQFPFLSWFSILVFVSAYFVSIYGKTLTRYLLSPIVSLATIGLPLFSYPFGYLVLVYPILRDTLRKRDYSQCTHSEESRIGGFCLYCGATDPLIQVRETKRTKPILGVFIFGLVTIAFANSSFPIVTLDEGTPTFAFYTPFGLITEPAIPQDLGSEISKAFGPGAVFSWRQQTSSQFEPLELPLEWELLETDVFRSQVSSIIYERYAIGEDRFQVLRTRTSIPYMGDFGNLGEGAWEALLLVPENSENGPLKDDLLEVGEAIDLRLAILPRVTERLLFLVDAMNLILPYLPASLGAGVLFGFGMIIRRSHSSEEHLATKIATLSKPLQLISLTLVSLEPKRGGITGRELHEEAGKVGYLETQEEMVGRLKDLENLGIMHKEFEIYKGHVYRVWRPGS